jgi:hypothetical protein
MGLMKVIPLLRDSIPCFCIRNVAEHCFKISLCVECVYKKSQGTDRQEED